MSSYEKESKDKPIIRVPYKITDLEQEQKSVDEGHSPWKLDPVFVAQVFSSLLLSPKGIVGDYPIPYKDITIIYNDTHNAVAIVNNSKSKAKKVYLKKLIRCDESGIWTVIGYSK